MKIEIFTCEFLSEGNRQTLATAALNFLYISCVNNCPRLFATRDYGVGHAPDLINSKEGIK
jgi:hypothetical protein